MTDETSTATPLKVERFMDYAYAQSGVVYNNRDPHIPIMWGEAEQAVLKRFNAWRKTVSKERVVSVTGPLREVLEPGCGVVTITVMYEGDV